MKSYQIEDQLVYHEGLRLKPYRDTVGKLTIGVGRNLDDKGISKNEAMVMLRNDIYQVESWCDRSFIWFRKLSWNRQRVIIDMVFNLGEGGFLKFRKMIRAIEDGDFNEAARQMLDSKWAMQVGKRALRLAYMMKYDAPFGLTVETMKNVKLGDDRDPKKLMSFVGL